MSITRNIVSVSLLLGLAAVHPYTATAASDNPLALITMTEFSGQEAEDFHDCFWIGPVSYESYNIAYPDEGAVYWGTRFSMPAEASHLEIAGAFPRARYMSFTSYDKLTQPLDALHDAAIVASAGANPYADEDKSGGRYLIKVYPTEAPPRRAPNTLYLGSPEQRNEELPLILRTYVPAEGTDYTGGAGLPAVTLVLGDGSRLSGQAMCKAIGSPAPGSAERRQPSVVMEKGTYRQLVYGGTVPTGFPASEQVEWAKFWGGDVSISRLLSDREYFDKAVAGSEAGDWTKKSGFYANIQNEYISAYLNEVFGEVVVIEGRLPTTPTNGWDSVGGAYDMRYWSLCTTEGMVTTRYADCVYDSKVWVDGDRNYTIVVSKAVNRPANATAECGVTWLDWGEHGDGAGDQAQGYVIVRNMLADDFTHSIQNVKSILSAREDMGPYFPDARYLTREEFESHGCGQHGG